MAFLAAACGEDEALAREVRTLLDFDGRAGAFLGRSALEDEARGLSAEPQLLGENDIDGYQILSLEGVGGMGEVYRARELALGREVAIKVLARAAAGRPGDLRRFEAEARLASGLNHPNIVTIYRVGATADLAYIAMELVRGRTLRQMLAGGALPVPEALDLAVQLADALSAAHAGGIVHRDLKPENLMVTQEGLLKVLDFGIAKRGDSPDPGATTAGDLPAGDSHTEDGTILGTVGYMSPEQAAGRPVEPASDQFAFGAILYEMLAGRRAFQRSTRAGTLDAVLQGDPDPIETLDPAVKAPLHRLLARCLAKRPADRYPRTPDLAVELRRIRDERESAARPTRRRAIWLGAALVAAAAVGAGVAVWKARSGDTGLRSIAVLPFVNDTGKAAAGYISDGMTKGLIRGISRLSPLEVKSHSAVLHFQGKGVDPRDAGRRLSADAVVTGAVAERSGRIHVTAELVEVATGDRLWSQAYDGEEKDVLSIQEEIARAVVNDGIRLPLSADDRRVLLRKPTDDPEAYDLYLRAIRSIERETEEDFLAARGLLRRALARDPNFALAYVALATTYSIMAIEGYERPAEALPEVSRNVRRALDCDPDLPDAHSEAAVALFYLQWDWTESEREWSLALQSRGGGILPNLLMAYALQEWALGRPGKALELARRARALDPLSLRLMVSEADYLFHAGQLDEAAKLYESATRMPQDASGEGQAQVVPNAWLGLAEVRRAQGRFDEAIDARRRGDESPEDAGLRRAYATGHGAAGYREIETLAARLQLEALEQRSADGAYVSPLDFARTYAQLGERERAFAMLESAFADRSPGMTFLNVDRAWDAIRDDPRFPAFVRRVGLPRPS